MVLDRHSYSDYNLVLGVTSYFDDSGSDDESPVVMLGGPIMSRINFKVFSERWHKMMARHRIPEPLHMNDFVRPSGKHIGMFPEMKMAFFRDVVKLIAEHRVVLVNQEVCERSRSVEGRISYLVDEGSSQRDQIVSAHNRIVDLEQQHGKRLTGALAFDTGAKPLKTAPMRP